MSSPHQESTDVMSFANKSVDDMLNEIRSHSPVLDNGSSNGDEEEYHYDSLGSHSQRSGLGIAFHLPNLSTSPSTEPLKIPTCPLSPRHPTDSLQTTPDNSLVRQGVRHLAGPRSPIKTPSPVRPADSSVILSEDSSVVRHIPKADKPLPQIQMSESDYSIKSLPNMFIVEDSDESGDSGEAVGTDLSNRPDLTYKKNTATAKPDISRMTSTKSTMSISSVEAQLTTKQVNREMVSVALNDGMQGLTDRELRHMIGDEEKTQLRMPERKSSEHSSYTTFTSDSEFVSATEGEDTEAEAGDTSTLSEFHPSHDILTDVETTKEAEEDNATAADVTVTSGESTDKPMSPLSASSSFAADKFVLDVPQFEPDNSEQLIEAFEYDPAKTVSIQPRRVSAETSPRGELLDIWSRQKSFRSAGASHPDDFMSLKKHSSSVYSVQPMKPKEVRVVSSRVVSRASSAASSRQVSRRASREVSRLPSVTSSRLSSVSSSIEATRESKLGFSDLDPDSTGGSVRHTSLPSLPSQSAELPRLPELPETPQNASSDTLPSAVDLIGARVPEDSDSFLNDGIFDLDAVNEFSASEDVRGRNAFTAPDVSRLWRNGTLSGKSRIASNNENDSIQFAHLSMHEMENFMIRKRIASDGFEIKKANAKAELGSYVPVQSEQQGLMFTNSGRVLKKEKVEEQVEPASPDSDNISDLAIPEGIDGTSSASTSVDIDDSQRLLEQLDPFAEITKVRRVSVSTKDQTGQTKLVEVGKIVPSAAVSGISEVSAEDSRGSKSFASTSFANIGGNSFSFVRYDDLVPASRRDVKKDNGGGVKAAPTTTTTTTTTTPVTSPSTKSPSTLLSPSVSSANTTATYDSTCRLVCGEQGRLFLRLHGLRNINLPNIQRRNAKVKVVLDNGIHVLTTDFFDVGANGLEVPIDKEFEFIVAEQLEIVLTLKLEYQKLREHLEEVHERRKVKAKGVLGRLFGRKTVVETTSYVNRPPPYDPLGELVAPDGSFAKVRISFDKYKKEVYGVPRRYMLEGFNEWKLVKVGDALRPQPFKVCSLDAELFFVPRRSEYEVLPVSIKAALNQAREIAQVAPRSREGFMFQEGGDLSVWTRRYFKLDGYDLLAHNADTLRLRAKINLRRVVEIIYPEKPEYVASTESQRAISETLILNDAFKLRFSNGETIDFGCDSRQERDLWIRELEDVIQENNFRRQPWVKLMLKRMRQNRPLGASSPIAAPTSSWATKSGRPTSKVVGPAAGTTGLGLKGVA